MTSQLMAESRNDQVQNAWGLYKGREIKWRVKLLERREKAASGAKPGDMLFMPPMVPLMFLPIFKVFPT